MNRKLILVLFLAGVAVAVVMTRTISEERQPLSAKVLTDPQSAAGFARAERPSPLSFPEDYGPHPDYQTEWWYYTGNLESDEGQHFGYQLTFFRRALQPIGETVERDSKWGTNHIYMAHFAVTDVGEKHFYAFERFSRGSAGLAGAVSQPYAVWLENWRVEELGESAFRLRASNAEIEIDLFLIDEKGPILQGDEGFSRKGPEPGNASYYYSQTRLQSEGTLRVGDEYYNVEGLSWKDHEYSSSALSAGQVGWDWFSIQLDDGSEIMVYQIRKSDGSIDPFSSGTLITPDGNTSHLEIDDFVIETGKTWRSPHSSAVYPMGWTLTIPEFELELELRPYLEDQELNLSFIYWEGAVFVEGKKAGSVIRGEGYVEMTGYAESIEGQF